MSRQASTRRFLHTMNHRGKLPSIMAMVVLCLWPIWLPPCDCSGGVSGSVASVESAGIVEFAVPCPSCCETAPKAEANCDRCDSEQCPCETRIQNLERLKSSSTLTPSLNLSLPLTLDHVGSLSLIAALPGRVSFSFLHHVEDDSIGSASQRCAILCRWLK